MAVLGKQLFGFALLHQEAGSAFAIKFLRRQNSRSNKASCDDRPYLIVVSGPTGAGKTGAAKSVMKKFGIKEVEYNLVDNLVEACPSYMEKIKKLKDDAGETWNEFVSSKTPALRKLEWSKEFDMSKPDENFEIYDDSTVEKLRQVQDTASRYPRRTDNDIAERYKRLLATLDKVKTFLTKRGWNTDQVETKKVKELKKFTKYCFAFLYTRFNNAYSEVRFNESVPALEKVKSDNLKGLVPKAWKNVLEKQKTKKKGEKAANLDSVNDEHLKLSLTQGKSVIFETTGTWFSGWLLCDSRYGFAKLLKNKNYKIVLVEAYVDQWSTLKNRMWNRCKGALKNNNQVPRLPNCTDEDLPKPSGGKVESVKNLKDKIENVSKEIKEMMTKKDRTSKFVKGYQEPLPLKEGEEGKETKENPSAQYLDYMFDNTQMFKYNNSGPKEATDKLIQIQIN